MPNIFSYTKFHALSESLIKKYSKFRNIQDIAGFLKIATFFKNLSKMTKNCQKLFLFFPSYFLTNFTHSV